MHKTELKINTSFFGIKIKAYLDYFIQTDEGVFVYDWKTNSSFTYNKHRDQRLIYSWLVWKITGIIPTCIWYYAKHDKDVKDKFSKAELLQFELTFQQFVEEVKNKGDGINQYLTGNYGNPFNVHKSLCRE